MSRQATAVKQATAVWQTTQFLSVLDLSPAELEACLQLAASMKAARRAGRTHETPLAGRHIALLFDKPSLRTRSTFMAFSAIIRNFARTQLSFRLPDVESRFVRLDQLGRDQHAFWFITDITVLGQ